MYNEGQLNLYELPLSSFEDRIDKVKFQILNELEFDSLYPVAPFYSSQQLRDFHYNGFDTLTSQRKYDGNGALILQGESNFLTIDNLFVPANKNPYVVSFWAYVNEDLVPRSIINLSEIDPTNQSLRQHVAYQLGTMVKTIDNNGWALIELPFNFQSNKSHLKITFDNLEAPSMFIDELLIRPQQTNLYRQTSERLWKNNRIYPR